MSTGPEDRSDQVESIASLLRRSLPLLALLAVGVVVLGHSVDATRWLTPDGLRAAVGADEWYGPIGFVLVMVGAMFLPVIPKLALLGLAGILFGPWYGFVYAWVAQVVAMTVMFVLARTSLRRLARRLVHEHSGAIRRLELRLEHQGLQVVAALRLFYFMGTPISIMLSTTQLRLRDFVMGTGIGVVPAVALAVLSGDAVASGATAIEAALIGLAIVLVFGLGTLVRRRVGI